MAETFGFSYIGFLFLCCLFLPNIFYGIHPPVDSMKMKENKTLLALERAGQVLCTLLLLLTKSLNLHGMDWWMAWLGAALLLMVLYLLCWIRYFSGGRHSADFYRPFLGVPLPLAVLPVVAVLLLSAYGRTVWLGVAALLLGIGHIGVTAQHWLAFKGSE